MQHPSQPSSPYSTPRDRGTPGSERPTGQSPRHRPSTGDAEGNEHPPTTGIRRAAHPQRSTPVSPSPRRSKTSPSQATSRPCPPPSPRSPPCPGRRGQRRHHRHRHHRRRRPQRRGRPHQRCPALARNWYPSQALPHADREQGPDPAGEIAVDATGAARHHAQLGDRLRVITPTTALPITVVGITCQDGPNPGVATVYFDTPRPKISCSPSPAGSPRSPSTLPPAAPTPLCGNVCRPHSAPATPSGNGPHRRTGATPPHPRRHRHRAEPPRPHLTLLLVTR